MGETTSERRLAENEAVFRRMNEQVQSGFEETNRLAFEDNQPQFAVSPQSQTTPLKFYCECADEKCAMRVIMTLEEYVKIHENRRRFIIVPGHDVTAVEKIVQETPDYTVVEKNVMPPENPEAIHPTSIGNA